MTPDELKKRFRAFALRCIKLAKSFPSDLTGKTIGGQLIRSSTGAYANYNAACLARSKAEFAAKIGIVVEETDESVLWVDLAPDVGLTNRNLVGSLIEEGQELLSIVMASRKTACLRKF